MATRQIVIELEEADYIKVQLQPSVFNGLSSRVYDAIKKGKILPQGHGRLIDADVLKYEMERDMRKAMSFSDLSQFVWLAPSVLDTEEVNTDG